MAFDLNKCVNYISENNSKKISEAFGRWLSENDITRIQWIALYFILTRGDMSQRDLSKHMDINDSSAMRLIERLERDGYIVRNRSQEDRRIILIGLTDVGRKLIEALLPIGEEFNALLLEGISPEELFVFQKVMDKMYSNIMNDPRSVR